MSLELRYKHLLDGRKKMSNEKCFYAAIDERINLHIFDVMRECACSWN